MTAAEIIQRCQDDSAANVELRGAIEELCGKLCGRKLGGRFKHFQRRNFAGKMLDKAGEDRTKTNRWAVFAVGLTANPTASAPASPAENRPDAGDTGNAGRIPAEDASASAKPWKKRIFGNNPNRGEGGAA